MVEQNGKLIVHYADHSFVGTFHETPDLAAEAAVKACKAAGVMKATIYAWKYNEDEGHDDWELICTYHNDHETNYEF